MRTEPRLARRGKRGFVLVLVLWASALVLLVAAALDRYIAARIELATAIRWRVQDELDAYSTEASVMYLLATGRFTRAGLVTAGNEPVSSAPARNAAARIDPVGGELALDGSSYRGIGRARFSLQDESGLVALNANSSGELEPLLQTFGSDPAEISRLSDALADYRDRNTSKRVNGAEAEEYAAAGLDPPANSNLFSVSELARVFGWREWLRAHPDFRAWDWLSVSRVAAFNPNVVPASLLALLPGMDEDKLQIALGRRREEPFVSQGDFEARTGLSLARSEDELRFFPSESLQIRIWSEGAARARLLAIQLTPLGRDGPWRIGGGYQIPRYGSDEAQDGAAYLFDDFSLPAR